MLIYAEKIRKKPFTENKIPVSLSRVSPVNTGLLQSRLTRKEKRPYPVDL